MQALALIAQQNQSTMERVVERLTDVGGPQKTHVTHQDEFHFATMEKSAAVESVFFALDSNGTGCIMKEEVVFALADLGAFDGINSRVAGQAVASAMKVRCVYVCTPGRALFGRLLLCMTRQKE